MAKHRYSSSYEDDEDYIDFELFSSQNFFCCSINSPSPTRDFEFQICPFSLNHNKNPKISPADELFYKGKLLPLHLPPRLQMLQNLINDPSPNSFDTSFLLNYSPTKFTRFPTKISVGNPCQKPNNCLVQFHYRPLKKLSLMAKKIKASTSYLKSLFSKSGDEFSCTKSVVRSTIQLKQADDYFDDLRYMEVSNRSPFSFSSSSNSTSNDLKRNSRSKISDCEIENLIEGAIDYCKKSYEQLLCSSEAEVCSMAVSALVTCGNN